MTDIGRNDPCPCGSGRKYKKCCLARDDAAAASDHPGYTPRESAMAKLLKFADRVEFDRDHEMASLMFWGGRLTDRIEDEVRDLLESDDTFIKYNAWFLFDLDIEDGVTVADMFLARKSREIDERERAFIDRMRESHLRLYEIRGVERGEGLYVLDLWTKERIFVREQMGSTQLVRWDVLGARIVPDEDGTLNIDGGIYLYPAGSRRDLLNEFRRRYRSYVGNFPDEDDRDFFKRHGMIFHHAWLDLVALRPPPHIVTAEGDQMMFATSVFDMSDEPALRRALAGREDVDTEDDGSFVWLEEASGGRRPVANLRVDGRHLIVETLSKARADRARAWVEGIAGPAVSHRATSLESIARAMESHRDTPPEPDSAIPPEVEAGIIHEMYGRHYREWLDQSVPALSNHTPREAAASKTLRPRLVDLLKGLDSREARAALQGRRGYDTSWIWAELGIDRRTGTARRAGRSSR